MTGVKNDGARWVRSEADLAGFRARELTPAKLLGALATHGHVHVPLDPGVGKTDVCDRLIDEVRQHGPYDLIVYLTAQRQVIDERPFAVPARGRRSSRAGDVIVLRPRPKERCGGLNARWEEFEKSGCSALGKDQLCAACPRRSRCDWPGQLTKRALAGKRIVAATQQYLQQVPDLIDRLRRATEAARVLVILDEAAFIDADMRVSIPMDDLNRNLRALKDASTVTRNPALSPWIDIVEDLLDADAPLGKRSLFPLTHDLATAVQDAGVAAYGAAFRYRLFDVRELLRCPSWRGVNDVGFIRRPRLDAHDYLILAAGMPISVARYRLDAPDLHEMYGGARFLHEDTRVFNLRCGLGAAVHFRRNAPQILFAAAQLLVELARNGKRAVLVSRKCFVDVVRETMQKYLRTLTGLPYRVVARATSADIANPHVVPVVTYGAVGTNRYESFDAAVAVNSFNMRSDTLDERINDTHEPQDEVRVAIDNEQGGRRARAKGYLARQQGYDGLAREFHRHLELGVVVQALGRVRFATRPRLVVFFQDGDVPFPTEREFRNLAQLREHLGLMDERSWSAQQLHSRAVALAAAGKTRAAIARELGVTERTISRANARKRKG
jgi:hypothetical protein